MTTARDRKEFLGHGLPYTEVGDLKGALITIE